MVKKLFLLVKNEINADVLALTISVLNDVAKRAEKKDTLPLKIFINANKVLKQISSRWVSGEQPLLMLTEKELYTMAYTGFTVTDCLLDDEAHFDNITFFKNAEKFFDCYKDEIGPVDEEAMFKKSGLFEMCFPQ